MNMSAAQSYIVILTGFLVKLVYASVLLSFCNDFLTKASECLWTFVRYSTTPSYYHITTHQIMCMTRCSQGLTVISVHALGLNAVVLQLQIIIILKIHIYIYICCFFFTGD